MFASVSFQNKIIEELHRYFTEVKKEWSISSNATDAFSVNGIYAPRLDIAVGPFNVEEGNRLSEIATVFSDKAPLRMKNLVKSECLVKNTNPRCTLAIEVAFSGSEKHYLGDITNASMMGLYGFVITCDNNSNDIKRIFEYTKTVKRVGKAPDDLFSNVCVLSDDEFLELLLP